MLILTLPYTVKKRSLAPMCKKIGTYFLYFLELQTTYLNNTEPIHGRNSVKRTTVRYN